MRIVGLLPDPLLPSKEVVAKTLARLRLQQTDQSPKYLHARMFGLFGLQVSAATRIRRVAHVLGHQTSRGWGLHETEHVPHHAGIAVPPASRNGVTRALRDSVIDRDEQKELLQIWVRRRLPAGDAASHETDRHRECDRRDEHGARGR